MSQSVSRGAKTGSVTAAGQDQRQGRPTIFGHKHVVGAAGRGRGHDLDADPGLFQRGAKLCGQMRDLGPGADKQDIDSPFQRQ